MGYKPSIVDATAPLLGVLIVFPLLRPWLVRWMRESTRRLVAAATQEKVRRWAARSRLGLFTYAYLYGCAGGGLGYAACCLLVRRTGPGNATPDLACAALLGLLAADWGAQFWQAREKRIEQFVSAQPLPELAEAEVVPVAASPLPAPVGLLSGLGILGAVFAAVLALATFRNQTTTPDKEFAVPEVTATPPPAVPRVAERAPAENAPPLVIGAATPPPGGAPGPTPMYRDVDFGEVIRQMNEEANALMPYALPLPVPEDQHQQLASQFQKMATKYFPDLAVRGSQLNREFVARYQLLQQSSPTFFEQPDWPVRLTIECVDLLAAGKATQEEQSGTGQ